MMGLGRIYLVSVMIALVSFKAQALVSESQLNELKACVVGLKDPQNAMSVDLRQKCFQMALEVKDDPSIRANALFLSARANFVESYTKESYETLLKEMNVHFENQLLAILKKTSFPSLSDLELEECFDAFSEVQFYSSLISEVHLTWEWLEKTVFEMKARRIWTFDHTKRFFDLLLAKSEWKRAQQLTFEYPQLPALPEVQDSLPVEPDDLAYFEYSEDFKKVSLRKLEIEKGPRIVVFGNCHFATEAFRKLNETSGIQEVMQDFGISLAAASGDEIEALKEVRQEFPAFELHPIYRSGTWSKKGFNVLEMPNFIFLKDGEIRHSFAGSLTVVEDFCQGIESIGIPTPKSCEKTRALEVPPEKT